MTASSLGPGPTPMALGRHKFTAIGFHFHELARSLETPWAEIEVAQRMEALHWTGPKSETVTIKGVLFPQEFGGLSTLAALMGDAKAGRIMHLATRDGHLEGRFVVTHVEAEGSLLTDVGTPRKSTYSIKLKRYGGR